MICMLAALAAVLGAVVAGEVWAVAATGERTRTMADAVAHAAVVAALPFADDLSVSLQAAGDSCHYQLTGGIGGADLRCAEVILAAQTVLAAEPAPHGELLELVLQPDLRDMASGAGAGRIGAIAVVAIRRGLPGCSGVPPPGPDQRSICWARAVSAAQQT